MSKAWQGDLGAYIDYLIRVTHLSPRAAQRWVRDLARRGRCWIFPDDDQPSGERMVIAAPPGVPGFAPAAGKEGRS